MQAMWISLKDNVNCGSKLTSGVLLPEKCNGKRSISSVKENLDKELVRRFRKSFSDVINKGFHSRTLYCELKIGDPARNVTEMIFKRALTNPSKQSTRKIIRVLRVKNSTEVLERFEKYREKVKELSHNHQKTHPRSTVDGNELMRFYGTTMACSSERSRRFSDLCRDPSCRVCRIIQSKFDTDYTNKNGIRLSTNSDQLIDDPFSLLKARTERAVIVCRIIAGTVVHRAEEVKEGCGSVGSERHYSSSEPLVVKDPSAVLPCFVMVFT